MIVGSNGDKTSFTNTDNTVGGSYAFYNTVTVGADADVTHIGVGIGSATTASQIILYIANNSTGAIIAQTAQTAISIVNQEVKIALGATTALTAGTYRVGWLTNGFLFPLQNGAAGNNLYRASATFPTMPDPVSGSLTGEPLPYLFLEGTSGPTITSITDPISDSISITLSEAAPTVDTIEITVGTRTEAQSYTTGDDTVFTIASISRSTLPPIGTATVTLKAGATEIVSQAVELDPRVGYTAWTGSSIDFTTNGLAYGYSGSLPVDGDIAEVSDAGNSICDGTESASSWVLAQNDEKKVEARIWQASTELWGTATIFATAANRQLHGKGLQVETMTATSLSATSL